jgi:hypothetical protein
LRMLAGADLPGIEWTTNRDTALDWIANGYDVFARRTLTGQGGSGIVVVRGTDPLPEAPLYTKGFRAVHEFRVHSVAGQTLVVKKRRRNGAERNIVRNHANGYVYCSYDQTTPHAVKAAAMGREAVDALGLDFGAVDLLMKEDRTARVLEINSAPGLEGSTVDFYANAFRRAYA